MSELAKITEFYHMEVDTQEVDPQVVIDILEIAERFQDFLPYDRWMLIFKGRVIQILSGISQIKKKEVIYE